MTSGSSHARERFQCSALLCLDREYLFKGENRVQPANSLQAKHESPTCKSDGAAWALAQKVLIVSARLEWDARNLTGSFQGNGIVK